MSFVCEICKVNPNSHSLKNIYETDKIIVYYTCPSEGKNNELEGIKHHFNGTLSEIKDKKWIWILDLKEFGLDNLFRLNNFIELSKIITGKYGSNLEKIILINENIYTRVIYDIFKSALSKRMSSIINFLDDSDKNASLNEKLTKIINKNKHF